MADTKVRERWYVTTDFFRAGGKALNVNGHILGPYDTREEALACREGFELGTGRGGIYYVDNLATARVEG